MEQLRMIQTPDGPATYLLEHKKVKNLNLRLTRQGRVRLSVPLRYPAERADIFVAAKWSWIAENQARMAESCPELAPEPPRAECLARLTDAVERILPRIAPLGVTMPEVRIRRMRSQWGNCHWAQGYVTLNLTLARCPEHLQDYVALHELAHFLHHDH